MRLTNPDGAPAPPPTRRRVLAASVLAGYAAAARAADADPVVTPSDGLIIDEEVRVFGDRGDVVPAYLARPDKRGRRPAVIVVNEIFGIHDYIKDICRRFAHAGYVALAPNYFFRAGDPSQLTDMAAIREIVMTATLDQVLGDTGGAMDWLRGERAVKDRQLCITGFCWGGSVVWMACARANFIAGAAWYGRLTPPPPEFAREERPWPTDIAGDLMCPVLGLYGGLDQGIPLDSVEGMRAALAAGGNPTGSEIVVYPQAQHGFHADYRASYDAASAADGWARMLAWFRANGARPRC
jgi:carboxymethylenebutenolidase